MCLERVMGRKLLQKWFSCRGLTLPQLQPLDPRVSAAGASRRVARRDGASAPRTAPGAAEFSTMDSAGGAGRAGPAIGATKKTRRDVT